MDGVNDIELSLLQDKTATKELAYNGNNIVKIDRPVYTAKHLKEWMNVDHLNMPKSCKETCAELCCDPASCTWSKTCLVNGLLKRFPIINQVRSYKLKSYFLSDLIAGLTIGIMHIPQGMGFALLAGLPPVYGLYTSFFPVITYFFFSSSRSTSYGSQSLVCLMLGPILERECENAGLCTSSESTSSDFMLRSNETLAENTILPGYQVITDSWMPVDTAQLQSDANVSLVAETAGLYLTEAMEFKLGLAVILAFLIGVIQMLLSFFQLGVISVYFSETFISACNAGAAFQIVTTQVKFMLGLPLPPVSGRFKLIKTWILVFQYIKLINIADFIVSALSLIILILVKKLINENAKLKSKLKIPIPIEILVVIISTAISYLANLEGRFNVTIVGKIPQGIPSPKLPQLQTVKAEYVMDAFPIALIGFLSAVLMAKLFANKYDYQVDINQELFANGIANTLSSFFACFPSSVSPPRTMLFDSVGGKTQVAFLFSSALVLLVLLVIGHLFQSLPTAVLACIIVVALIPLFERLVDGKYLWSINKLDFVVWLGTLLSVILLDLGLGIIIGVFLSIISVVLHTQKPKIYSTSAIDNSEIYLDSSLQCKLLHSAVQNNVTIVKIDSPLYYANIDVFSKRILSIVNNLTNESGSKHKRKDKEILEVNLAIGSLVHNGKEICSPTDLDEFKLVLVLDFSAVHYMDIVGLKGFKTLHKKVVASGLKVVLCCCNMEILKLMERFGLLEIVGDSNIFFTVHDAVTVFSV